MEMLNVLNKNGGTLSNQHQMTLMQNGLKMFAAATKRHQKDVYGASMILGDAISKRAEAIRDQIVNDKLGNVM